jgi:hypothetical protein
MRARRDHGFALPLVLAVLAVLSYLVAIGVQRIEVARAESRLAQSNVRAIIDLSRLEQDITWRAVLETIGTQPSVLDSQPDTFLARPPRNEWLPNGQAYIWSPTYETGSDRSLPPALVLIRDEASKIDLNQPTEGFMRLLAERAELSPGARRRAIDELRAYRESRTPAAIDTDDRLSLPIRSGLLDPMEVCTLPSWADWSLCQDEEAFRMLFTAGQGVISNIRLLSEEASRFLLGTRYDERSDVRETQWGELRANYGFYNPIEGLGFGGVRFDVTILVQNSNRARRFILDMRRQEKDEPFAVKLIRYVDAETVRDEIRSHSSEILAEFDALTVNR